MRKKSNNPTKKLAQKLEKICHDYIRRRDSINPEIAIGGYCFDCGKMVFKQMFQAGHFLPSGSSGAILRYHPHNIHGQASGCNCHYQQEQVKIRYTMAMIKKYGKKYVDKLIALKNKSIKADSIFYEKMIELYEQGDEEAIVDYLESL